MKRRALVTAAGALALAPAAAGVHAQPAAGAMRRIGLLSFGSAPGGSTPDPDTGFRQGLAALGWVEGRNLVVESRYADGRPERLARMAAELLAARVELIVTGGPAPFEAARKATTTVAIVTIAGADPVREGWAQTLARPGGNVTGLTVTFPELGPKGLELLKQAFPGLQRVGVVYAPAELGGWVPGWEAASGALNLQLQRLEVSGPVDLDAAFVRGREGRAQCLDAISTNTIVTQRASLAELAITYRLPMLGEFPLLVEAGFLMSYGADLNALGRRAASYVGKILEGAKPGELPIERPSEFELVINRRTERALGIALPAAFVARANRLIE